MNYTVSQSDVLPDDFIYGKGLAAKRRIEELAPFLTTVTLRTNEHRQTLGLSAGDMLVIHKSRKPQPGDVVVYDDGRLRMIGLYVGKVILRPGEKIIPKSEVHIIGVVVPRQQLLAPRVA